WGWSSAASARSPGRSSGPSSSIMYRRRQAASRKLHLGRCMASPSSSSSTFFRPVSRGWCAPFVEAEMSTVHRGVVAAMALLATSASAEKKYDPGASDTEIRIGQTMPYSGPASAYGTIGRVEAAYFRKINDQGGVNGRKLNLISADDAYNPSKTVEM